MHPQNELGGRAAGAVPAEAWAGAVDAALARHRGVPGALLPVLHDVQDAVGFVPPEAHARIADALSLSRADVHGVVTFYHDFRSRAPGRHVVRVCRAEACQAMGSDAIAARVRAAAGADFGGTSPDGAVTLESVYCLGNCACAPSAMVDGNLVGRLTPDRAEQIVRDARAAR